MKTTLAFTGRTTTSPSPGPKCTVKAVFYSTLGHTQEAWSDPDILKMYFEATKWVLGMTEGSTNSHPGPQTSGNDH